MGEIIGRSEEGFDAGHTTEIFFFPDFSCTMGVCRPYIIFFIWMLRSRYACSNVGLTSDVFA